MVLGQEWVCGTEGSPEPEPDSAPDCGVGWVSIGGWWWQVFTGRKPGEDEDRATSPKWKGSKRTDFCCGSGPGPALGPSGLSALPIRQQTRVLMSATGQRQGGTLSLVRSVWSLQLRPAFRSGPSVPTYLATLRSLATFWEHPSPYISPSDDPCASQAGPGLRLACPPSPPVRSCAPTPRPPWRAVRPRQLSRGPRALHPLHA